VIPLRASEGVEKFPWPSVGLLGFFLLAEVVSRILGLVEGSHGTFLANVAFVPSAGRLPWGAWLFHPHLFALVVSLLYLWVFTPPLFARRAWPAACALALAGTALAMAIFGRVFAASEAPVLCPEAFVGALLGMAMRRDIWGTVNTLVVGPGWVRLYDVPSYVLLFFWFFYLLLGNLFLSEPFENAPMLYGLPFVAFLWGFLAESVWALFDPKSA
jgi:hypothetical protein